MNQHEGSKWVKLMKRAQMHGACAVQALWSSSESGCIRPTILFYEISYGLDLGLLSFHQSKVTLY